MEELEPWNMFTNDFVADENDTNGNCEDSQGNTNYEGNRKGDEEDAAETNFLVPEVTMGGGEMMAENGEEGDEDDIPGEDDDALFNFELDGEKVSPSRPKRIILSPGEISRNKKELESLINYDQAVVYICPADGTEYETQEDWKRHMNGVHAFNTRQGLNFVQIDKLYHECLQCFKRIAMHSMENLLKHKYTHLPYRCSKCKFCHRQYKYRQDLMVHLRTQHYHELIEVAKAAKEALDKQQENHQNVLGGLAIREIKENAIDIFENTVIDSGEPVRVRNEVMEPDGEHSRNSILFPPLLEDALSRESSRNSEPQSIGSGGGGGNGGNGANVGIGGGNGVGGVIDEHSLHERQIQYICPKCAQEYGNQSQWQQHIVSAHDYGTRRGLNFEEINSNQQARCLECEKIIPVNLIHHLQHHKFSHLPNKFWLRCKICFEAFPSRQDILKHLVVQHRIGGRNESYRTDNDEADVDDSQDIWDCDDSLLTEAQRAPTKQKKHSERDTFDQHIEYLCPTCGNEFRIKKLWRKHIGTVHKLTSLEALNFMSINEREVQCLECGKIITNAYGIQNAQQHYFTHMPFKSFIRCRLCSKSYTDRKGLIKHLRGKHFGRIKQFNETKTKSHPTTAPPPPPPLPPLPPATSQPQPQIQLRQAQQLQKNPNNLLSRALQRPLRHVDVPPPTSKRKRPERYKEIVRHKNYVYEIEFIDEDEDELCDNEVGIVNAAHEEIDEYDDGLLGPGISNRNNGNNFIGRDRCADCGSIFSTPEALRAHISKEHDFYERPQNSNTDNSNTNRSFLQTSNNDHSNDDELLMPVKSESVATETSSSAASASGDFHFTYLCPACGLEHYTQMEWRRHINTVHNFDKRQYLNFRQLGQDRFQCAICNDIVTKSKLKTLQDHKFRHLPFKSYLKCKYCGTLYNHKPNMYGHLQVRHKIYAPRNTVNEESNNDDYTSSPAASSKPRMTQTANAGGMQARQMSSYKAATAPSTNSNNSTPFAKPPGLKTAEDVITFHNAVDHATITYFCPSCNENFDSHVFWRKHIVEEHNLNSREGLNFRQIDEHHFLCLQCYKRVTVTHTKGAIGQLQSHKFRHLPYKSFRCLRCNGEFVRKQMFFKHLNRATNRCESNIKVSAAVAAAQERNHHAAKKNVALSSPDPKALGTTVMATKQSVPFDNALDAYEVDDDATNASLIMNQDAFILVCPQCAAEFESTRNWREHINTEHDLGKRENLGFKRINTMLHKCLVCGEHVSGRKLRDLQVHRFKHLPYGPYIQCKFCKTGYNYISKMQDHLRHKHPNVVQKHEEYAKMEEMRLFEESSLTDADSLGASSVVNEAELDDDDDEVQVVPPEEINDDNDQYLLG